MNPRRPPPERAVTPAVGIVLLVAIVTLIAAGAGSVILGLVDERPPAPDVAMDLESTGDGVHFELRHVSGEGLDGERTRLGGVADEDGLRSGTFRAGETATVVPIADEVTLHWDGTDTSYTLQSFDVNTAELRFDPNDVDSTCPEVEAKMNSNSGDLDLDAETVVCDVAEDTDTGYSDIDIDLDDDSVLIGSLDVDGDVDLDSAVVVGSVTTTGQDITITDGSEIFGTVVAPSGTNVDADGNATIEGDVVVHGGSLSLSNVEVTGHVYADPADVSCSSTTIGPAQRSCSAYSVRDPATY